MADVQTQPTEEGLTHSQVSQNVIADIVAADPWHNLLKSSTNGNHYDAGQMHEILEMQDELPPYDNVSAEIFIMKLDGDPERSSNWMQWLGSQRPCPCIMQCPTNTTFEDFILLSSQSGCSSDQASSVVSCFTDDLSYSTKRTETLTADPLNESTPQTLKNSMLQGSCQDNLQSAQRSSSDITDWLCSLDCTQSEDKIRQHGAPLPPPDEQKDVADEESAG
jgi:hypothetical protein